MQHKKTKNEKVAKMNKLKNDGIIPEMQTTTWKKAVVKGEQIKARLAKLKKLTTEEKDADNREDEAECKKTSRHVYTHEHK